MKYLISRVRLRRTLMAALLAMALQASMEAQVTSCCNSLRQQAADLIKNRRIAEAESLLTSGISAARRDGEAGTGLAEALSDLGALYFDSAHLSKAERSYKESIALWEKTPGTDPNFAATLGNLASLRLSQARLSDALKLYRRAEQILISHYGSASPRVAWVSCGIADVYWQMGSHKEAKQTLDRTLAALNGSGRDMEFAIALFLRAKIAWTENRNSEAEQLIRQAIDLWGKSLGSQHPTYASALTSLAVLISRRDPVEAEHLFRQSLEIIETQFGPDHAYAGFTDVLYARHLKAVGRRSEAKSMKRRGEEILARNSRENLLGYTLDIKAFASTR